MARSGRRQWSRRVTRESDALDLEPGVFNYGDPRRIARSLKRSADRSRRRKAEPFRSAMATEGCYALGDRRPVALRAPFRVTA
jgi:Protein of unknown function (DUF3175)